MKKLKVHMAKITCLEECVVKLERIEYVYIRSNFHIIANEKKKKIKGCFFKMVWPVSRKL